MHRRGGSVADAVAPRRPAAALGRVRVHRVPYRRRRRRNRPTRASSSRRAHPLALAAQVRWRCRRCAARLVLVLVALAAARCHRCAGWSALGGALPWCRCCGRRCAGCPRLSLAGAVTAAARTRPGARPPRGGWGARRWADRAARTSGRRLVAGHFPKNNDRVGER